MATAIRRRNVSALLHGTILFGAVRGGFALLSSDSLEMRTERGGATSVGQVRKIVLLQKRGVAFAASGMGRYLEEQSVAEVAASAMRNLSRRASVSEMVFAARDALSAGVVQKIKVEAEWSGVAATNLLFATFRENTAQIWLLLFTASGVEVASMPLGGFFLDHPPCLADFYNSGAYASEGARGTGQEKLARLVDVARRVVEDGLSAESGLHGSFLHAGPPIDVAVVDRRGARFVSQAATG